MLIDQDHPVVRIDTPKYKQPFEVYKLNDNTPYFGVRLVGIANTPQPLTGRYSSVDIAISSVHKFLATARWTQAAKNAHNTVLREKRKLDAKKPSTKANSKPSEGSDN